MIKLATFELKYLGTFRLIYTNLGASDADIKITSQVREALKLVDIQLLDHLILNKDEEFATIDV